MSSIIDTLNDLQKFNYSSFFSLIINIIQIILICVLLSKKNDIKSLNNIDSEYAKLNISLLVISVILTIIIVILDYYKTIYNLLSIRNILIVVNSIIILSLSSRGLHLLNNKDIDNNDGIKPLYISLITLSIISILAMILNPLTWDIKKSIEKSFDYNQKRLETIKQEIYAQQMLLTPNTDATNISDSDNI
jgi:hypothetical protein